MAITRNLISVKFVIQHLIIGKANIEFNESIKICTTIYWSTEIRYHNACWHYTTFMISSLFFYLLSFLWNTYSRLQSTSWKHHEFFIEINDDKDAIQFSGIYYDYFTMLVRWSPIFRKQDTIGYLSLTQWLKFELCESICNYTTHNYIKGLHSI